MVIFYDVTDPKYPTEVSIFTISDSIISIKMDSDLAIIVSDDGVECQLRILRIDNPFDPIQISSLNLGFGFYSEMKFMKDKLAIIDSDACFRVFDLSDPYFPFETGVFCVDARDIDSFDDYVFVVSYDNVIHAYDISEPYHIDEVWTYEDEINIFQLDIELNTLYASGGYETLFRFLIFDTDFHGKQPTLNFKLQSSR